MGEPEWVRYRDCCEGGEDLLIARLERSWFNIVGDIEHTGAYDLSAIQTFSMPYFEAYPSMDVFIRTSFQSVSP